MGHVSHKNVVHTVGFCLDVGETMALVTRFYPNGSVASRTRGTPPPWPPSEPKSLRFCLPPPSVLPVVPWPSVGVPQASSPPPVWSCNA